MFVHTRVTCVHFSTVLQLFEQNVTIITNHPLHAIIPPKMFCEAEMYQFHPRLQASPWTLIEKCSSKPFMQLWSGYQSPFLTPLNACGISFLNLFTSF